MNTIVFGHVLVGALPAEWRARLAKAPGTTVTVRIEAEDPVGSTPTAEGDSLVGMWRDRVDMADVAGYLRSIRADRFSNGDAG
ncbi:MAG: hypothetical protein LH480_15470 [Rubrivivax sp.]|nr:hypothetical protein [Rubrivivax sp.]